MMRAMQTDSSTRGLIMSSTPSHRVGTLFETDSLVHFYALERKHAASERTDLAVIALFSLIGLVVSVWVAAKASPSAVDAMMAALLS